MEELKIKNPWLGLESYKEGEVLYGRDDDIRDLSQSVLNDKDTLLYGKSGIGKSSILNAGILPAARRNGFLPVLVRLSHKEKNTYFSQIKDAIANAILPIPLDEAGNPRLLSADEQSDRNAHLKKLILEVIKCKDPAKESLYEYFHRHTFNNAEGERIKLLIIFDQFEEIFTLQTDESAKKKFFSELADLLNDIMPSYLHQTINPTDTPQNKIIVTDGGNLGDLFNTLNLGAENNIPEYISDNEIHLVFTIREDFLSEFEYYTSGIPSLKQNRYGLRPINEEQAAQIIMRPMPGLIDEKVAKLIIEKVTGRTDFILDGIPEIEVDSAVLSLYLNRLFDAKQENTITSELVEIKGGEIISDFYNDAISTISEASVEYLEEHLLNGQGRRDNITAYDAVHDGGITESELEILCIKKKILRVFNYAGDLRIEFVHDILCPVVKAHKEERLLLKQQEEDRKKQEEEKRRLQVEAEKKQREIEEKAAAEKAKLEAAALRTKRKTRRTYTILFVISCIIGLIWTRYYYAEIHIYKSYYKDFTRINGWPVGIEELSEQELKTTPLYYCLSHKGSKSPIMRLFGFDVEEDLITDIEIMASNASLPHKPRINTFEVVDIECKDAKALAYNELLSNIRKIHFVGGENDVIEKEVALNDKDSTLFVITYFHINNSDMWGTFLTPEGQSMQIRENSIDRMKISTDSLGRIRSLVYYDQNGVCQPINEDICGFSWNYNTKDGAERRYLLDQFSLPVNKQYNMVITQRSNESTLTKYRHVNSVDDVVGKEAVGPEGFSKLVSLEDKVYMYVSEADKNFSTKKINKDEKGNVISEYIENNLSPKTPSLIKYNYDKNGELIKMEKLSTANTPFAINAQDNYLYEWEYADGKKVKEIRKNLAGITFQHTIVKKNNVTTETFEDVSRNEFIVKLDSVFKDGYSTSFYGRNNLPIERKVKLEEDSISFHRMLCIKQGNNEKRYFYIYENQEKKAPLNSDRFGKALSYYCKELTRDSYGNIISYIKRDENGRIIKSMMFFTLNGQVIGRAVQGIDGTPVRCNKWEEEGYLYYKIYYCKDFDGNFVGIQALNEWGQRSAFYDPSSKDQYQSVSYIDFRNAAISKESYNTSISRSYKQFVFEKAKNISDVIYPYLHILDKKSDLYKSGLKDGDRIVKFGKWTINDSFELLAKEWTSWNGSGKTMQIEVLRPINNGTVERIKKQVSCTITSKDLQEYHILALTGEEYKYLTNKNILK